MDPVPRQLVCHATSVDLKNWRTHPEDTFAPDGEIYEMSDWRDPHVIWNPEDRCWWMLLSAQKRGKTMRKGCVGLCVSQDLKHWQYRQPLYAPAVNQSAHECPDLFRWGDWWYLTYSVYTDRFQTLYRMSKSIHGPWITPKVDTFDTRCFYAAKHGTDTQEHFLYGWNPTKEQDIWGFSPKNLPGKDYNTWDWGGTMIVHRLIQQKDGTLCVAPPKAVAEAFSQSCPLNLQPLNGAWQIGQDRASVESPYAYASLLFNQVPRQCKSRIEQQWIGDDVGIHAIEAEVHRPAHADALVHHLKQNGAGGAELVVEDLLGVEVVNPLVLGGLAADRAKCSFDQSHIVFSFSGCGSKSLLSPKEPVELTFWHVYGEQADSPMDQLVDEFNRTVGREKGVRVKVTAQSSTSRIGQLLLESQAEGSDVEMPDLFTCHLNNAMELGVENLLDWKEWFHEDALGEFVPGFLADGDLDGKLYVFPVSKSTHVLMFNGNELLPFRGMAGVGKAHNVMPHRRGSSFI